ncbi:DinB family protein [Seonamhaeicola marinus]|uniref:DinB family protein n=1 Tax=Seonamhaeicola marinus TaxID=1912246 RepID=A0A5D0HWE5_9FLAO|nr:DinB family protein [Seonamhaeicola marinus]TYA74447.1 DinB family protein [Seonamhaeicola marinus]
MEYNIKQALEVLERTPEVLNTLLLGLSYEWVHNNEGENTWSPFDVVGHLIHGEQTDWLVRTHVILSDSKNKTFAPFDRFAQFEISKGKTIEQLLKQFSELRKKNIKKLKKLNLKESELNLKGMHKELGEVTLKELLACWVSHDLSHIAQISRVMAKQYTSEVGPWKAFIPILNT